MVLLTAHAATAQSGSSMFRGDPAHRGVSAAPLFNGQGGVVWRRPTGGAVRSTPAVTATRIFVGSGDSALYALNRSDGRIMWRFPAGDAVTSSPAVARGLVVAASHSGRIFAVNESTGKLQWSFRTGAPLPFNTYPAGGWDLWASSPVIVESTVIVGGADGLVYAIDLASGTIRWTVTTGGRVRATPAIADGAVIVGSWDGRVYALDLANGHQRWVHKTIGDTLDSHQAGFDRRAVQSSAAIDGGKVFVGSRDGGLYALDARTGERLWRFSHRGSWVVGSPTAKDGVVYVGSSDGHFVQAVDAATGTEKWRFLTDANVNSSPLLAHGMILIGTQDDDTPFGDLLALDAATGKLRWRFRSEEAIFSSPVGVDSVIYLGTDGGDVLAIGEANPLVPRLAVYYDSTLTARNSLSGARLAREYFVDLGYQLLGADSLRSFFESRIRDDVPSVVVFALDALPTNVQSDTGGSGIWQRYLKAGGKIVWFGTLPGSPVFDSAGRFQGNDLAATTPLTGFKVDSSDWNESPASPTAEGRRWGLTGHWRGDMPASPAVVSRSLALNSEGWATVWQLEYRKDRPYAGYLQVWGLGATVERLPMIRAVAEYGLLRRWDEK